MAAVPKKCLADTPVGLFCGIGGSAIQSKAAAAMPHRWGAARELPLQLVSIGRNPAHACSIHEGLHQFNGSLRVAGA